MTPEDPDDRILMAFWPVLALFSAVTSVGVLYAVWQILQAIWGWMWS